MSTQLSCEFIDAREFDFGFKLNVNDVTSHHPLVERDTRDHILTLIT